MIRIAAGLGWKGLLLILAAAVVLTIVVFWWTSSASKPAELDDYMATRLGLEKEQLVGFRVNLPPAPSRYPGAILDSRTGELLYKPAAPSPDIGRLSVGSMNFRLSENVTGGGSATFPLVTFSPSDLRFVDVIVELDSIYAIEVDRAGMLQALSLGSLARIEAKDSPHVILRAFEATVRVSVRRKEETHVNAWNRIRRRVTDQVQSQGNGLRLDSDRQDEFRIENPQRQVVAYITADLCSRVECGPEQAVTGADSPVTVPRPNPAPIPKKVEPLPKRHADTPESFGVTIQTIPEEADIQIDGKDWGLSPQTIQLSRGRHRILIQKSGYADIIDQFDVARSTPMVWELKEEP